MAQTLPTSPSTLPIVTAPSGWRVVPLPGPGVQGFRSPAGLLVVVTDLLDERARQVELSRSTLWPSKQELLFAVRTFLGERVPFECAQVHGLGPLTVRITHHLDDDPRDAQASFDALDGLALYLEEANRRREQSRIRQRMMNLSPPEGWRKKPGPLGFTYERDGVVVVFTHEPRSGGDVALVSLSRADRFPTEEEGHEVIASFLPERHGAIRVLPQSEQRLSHHKLLFLECSLDPV